MGLGKLLGFGGSDIAEPVKAVGSVLDSLFTSDEERLSAAQLKAALDQKPHLAQIALNTQEAKHRSLFVAGWRPFIGWVCGFSLLYSFIIRDIVAWIITNTGSTMSMPPELAMEHLMTILMGMLGLGGLRTYEKIKGKTK